MDDQIDQMVSKNLDLTEVKIQSKGVMGQEPGRIVKPNCLKIGDATDDGIVQNKRIVIEKKRDLEAVAVNHCPQEDNEEKKTKIKESLFDLGIGKRIENSIRHVIYLP